jgi:hypothetical protein
VSGFISAVEKEREYSADKNRNVLGIRRRVRDERGNLRGFCVRDNQDLAVYI